MPRVQETLDTLQGSQFFTVLDLSRAYYQGFVSEESKKKTGFLTPFGFYQWIRIPFGVSNAVPVFQRFMEGLLEECRNDYALPYLDDTIVFSKTVTEHIEHIRSVLRKFKGKGLKLNIAKCKLFQKEVNYLGRIVSREGYKMDDDNVEAVRDLLTRKYTNVGEVRQLLGLLGFHRRHIQDYSRLSKPMSDLLTMADSEKSNGKTGPAYSSQKIKWTNEHQQALGKLVELATNPPILAYPDMKKPFFVHTDASGAGLGAILYQKQDDKTRVIAYGSRTLRPAEKNYHASKLELLALKWAITEKFRDYLSYADHFDIYTDSNPLLFLMNLKKPNTCLQRWTSELAEFNFTVHYRAGSTNKDADCLSRLPLDIEKYVELCKEEINLDSFQIMLASVQADGKLMKGGCKWLSTVQVNDQSTNSDSIGQNSSEEEKLEQMKIAQEQDPDIAPIIKIMKGEKLSKSMLSDNAKLLLRERKKLQLDGNQILKRMCGMSSQMVLPTQYKEMIFKNLHDDMGHIGADKVSG